ncbi:TPA: Flp pilus assembly complex ATPase component TadA [Candidatus Scatousia excrementigallinarum]|uniref:Flp pilus assembly complex ATPase component TadA n=1 Tax=Candidatus Scatousia excrementigallinarum TaxID=2840935 RepID=A0A9D1JML2_9BACT|nr:Flp pilus assembly complex ATPase component TadA [Candidatus Scatousia excrementigallinarum]
MEAVTNKTLEKLKYDLVRAGLVPYETIEQAEEIANAQNINIGQALINSGVLTEDTIVKFLETKLHIPSVNLEDYTLDKKCLKYINFSDARKYKIIPLFKIEDTLTVAMADPLDLFAIDKIVETASCSIEPVISSESSILKKIDEYYKTDITVGEIFTDSEYIDFDWRDELHNEDLSDNHMQKIIRAILKQAILEQVHEVTFQRESDGLGVNFKKNGDSINKGTIPNVLTSSFIAKLKTLAELDPSVSEVPQLGKLCFKVDDIAVIASVSTFPTIMGERIFLKIYKPPKKLSSIINSEKSLKIINNALNSSGIILVCGSPLSGKTHIIYSLLTEIAARNKNKNIMTLESIAKYNLQGVNQCELNENISFNMDKASRFIEFQSPDIIYLEGVKTKEIFDYFSSLVYDNKTIIMEFLANNMEELRNKMAFSDFETLKSLLSCMIFIHSKDSIEVFNKETIQKYLA